VADEVNFSAEKDKLNTRYLTWLPFAAASLSENSP